MKQQKQQEEEKQQRKEEHARKQQEYKKKQIGEWWCMKLNDMLTVMRTYSYAHLVFAFLFSKKSMPLWFWVLMQQFWVWGIIETCSVKTKRVFV